MRTPFDAELTNGPVPKGRSSPMSEGSPLSTATLFKEGLNWVRCTYGRSLFVGGQPRHPSEGNVALADPNFVGSPLLGGLV